MIRDAVMEKNLLTSSSYVANVPPVLERLGCSTFSPKEQSVLLWNKKKQHRQQALSCFSLCSLKCTHYVKKYQNPYSLPQRQRSTRISVLGSDVPGAMDQGSIDLERRKKLREWDALTTKLSGISTVPFLLLQMPQVVLNAQNLMAGNKHALWAVPWLGLLTGLLGNLSLLSYFVNKREKEAIIVQTIGAVTTYVVFFQLALAEAMPLAAFLTTSIVVATSLALNFMYYFHVLPVRIWHFWEDFTTIGGLSYLPQIMWSTFVPNSTVLPGAIAFVIAASVIVMARTGSLSNRGGNFIGDLSGWTATGLFMWMPVSQMWNNYLNPNNIKGLSAWTVLLAMIGNALLIPRAILVRDFMWFIGSTWASLLYGYGNIVCLYLCKTISKGFFLAATLGIFSWIGMALWRDGVAHGYDSPMTSLKELFVGS